MDNLASTTRSLRVSLLLALLTLFVGLAPYGLGPTASADSVDEEVARIQAEIDVNGYCWTAARTSMMELPPEERALRLGLRLPPGETGMLTPEEAASRSEPGAFRSYFSWKDEGMMTPVKNQGSCGACWAFAPIAVLESRIKIVTGVEQDLSEQQMVSCTNDGCGGGWMSTAYNLMRSYGCVSELCMPYRASDNIPCTQYECEVVDKIESYYNARNTVSALKAALSNAPVSCAIPVYDDFYAYGGGCYQHSGWSPVNHAVTIVGWDDSACNGAGAWHCKNSWGGGWGEEGYFWIKYGSCNIGYAAQQISYTPLYPVVIAHAPLRNTDDTENDYLISAEVYAYLDDVDWVRVYYRVDGGTYTYRAMTHVEGDTYEGYIPAQPVGSTIDYYIMAQDESGRTGYSPKYGPPDHYTFKVVYFVAMDHCETADGWTVGLPGDDADEGLWECGDPEPTEYNGLPVQTDDDTTPDPGVNCFVTGAAANGGVSYNEVSGGKTTLVSPTYNLAGLEEADLAFDLWYVNEVGYAPVDDEFWVDVSDDGGASWTRVLTIDLGRLPGHWERYTFALQDYISLTDQVVVRFIASDYGVDDIVEAAVDEFEISTSSVPQAVGGEGDALRLALSAGPGVTGRGTTVVRFSLPGAGTYDLSVHAVDGRVVRHLDAGSVRAGSYTAEWDGTDDSGQMLPSGVYFIRLESDFGRLSRNLVLIR